MDQVPLSVVTPLRILAPQVGLHTGQGGGRYDYEFLAALARSGHKVLVVIPRAGTCNVPPGVETLFIEGRARGHALFWNAVFLPKLLRVAAMWKPDLIRVHSPYALGPAAILAGRLNGVPVVGNFFHLGEPSALHRLTESWLPPWFDQVNTPGIFTRAQLLALHPRLENRIFLAPCGVSDRFFVRQVPSEPLSDGPLFLCVCGLLPRKNLRWLLRLFEAWMARGGAGRLCIVGEGPQRVILEAEIAARGLGERIQLAGRLSDEEMLSLLANAELFLFPSLLEGFGLAVAEALAQGVPALVSDHGGLAEVVTHGQTGFVLPLDQGFPPWITAMQSLIDDPSLRRRMSVAARAEASARFRWDAVATQVVSDWRRLRRWRAEAPLE